MEQRNWNAGGVKFGIQIDKITFQPHSSSSPPSIVGEWNSSFDLNNIEKDIKQAVNYNNACIDLWKSSWQELKRKLTGGEGKNHGGQMLTLSA